MLWTAEPEDGFEREDIMTRRRLQSLYPELFPVSLPPPLLPLSFLPSAARVSAAPSCACRSLCPLWPLNSTPNPGPQPPSPKS